VHARAGLLPGPARALCFGVEGLRAMDTDRPKNPHAQALAQLGASKGGLARAAALSPATRKRIAKRAARARWARKPEPPAPQDSENAAPSEPIQDTI